MIRRINYLVLFSFTLLPMWMFTSIKVLASSQTEKVENLAQSPQDLFIPFPRQSSPDLSLLRSLPPSLFLATDPQTLLNGTPSACRGHSTLSTCADHLVYKPNSRAVPRAPLVVFLPGTNMRPDVHTQVLETAGYAQYCVIGLSYDNSEAVADTCQGQSQCGLDCNGQVRKEIILGQNVSPSRMVEIGDSIVDRLYRLLEHLDNQDPTGGWSNYYTQTSGPITWSNIEWGNIIVSGFSQGAGHAAMISHAVQVHGLVILDGAIDTCDPGTTGSHIPAEWLFATPDASDNRPKYGVSHQYNIFPYSVHQSWIALGLGSNRHNLDSSVLGDVIDIVPPADVSYTNQEPANFPSLPCWEHPSMARDYCMPTQQNNQQAAFTAVENRLFGPYLSRFWYACDSSTCP